MFSSYWERGGSEYLFFEKKIGTAIFVFRDLVILDSESIVDMIALIVMLKERYYVDF